MYKFMFLLFLPVLAYAETFNVTSDSFNCWMLPPEGQLEEKAEVICKERGMDFRRVSKSTTFYKRGRCYESADFECVQSFFTLSYPCGPFGGCLGFEKEALDNLALKKCLDQGFTSLERTSDYRHSYLRVESDYQCHKEEE